MGDAKIKLNRLRNSLLITIDSADVVDSIMQFIDEIIETSIEEANDNKGGE